MAATLNQQALLAKEFRRIMNGGKRQPRALRNVQERMVPIREIQDPKPSVDLSVNRIPAGAAVQISLAKLGLAETDSGSDRTG